MAQLIRILIEYPVLFIFQKIVQRFSHITRILVIITAMLFAIEYIRNSFPISLLQKIPTTPLGNVPEKIIKEITVKKGDTLGTVLRNQGLPKEDIQKLIKLAKSEKFTSNLTLGQVFSFSYGTKFVKMEKSELNRKKLILNKMSLQLGKIKLIEFIRNDGKFEAHHITPPLKKLVTKYETTIDSSIIASFKSTGMSTNNIISLINAYSHQVDFQRQIQPGDKITIVTEKFVTSKNKFSHHGKILYASLQTRGKKYSIYSYSHDGKKSSIQFFSENGSSIKSNLLRTPVNIVRISGNFGYRKKHPVLGYAAMHKGVDFATSIGTPIYAAGDGTVQFIDWKGGYGKFLLINHNDHLSTAYAHASRFSKKLKKGSKVKQGDVIAYVGKSGRVTGPHLHYEVRINGKQVNPMKFKSIPGIKLTGFKLAKFKKYKEQILSLNKQLTDKIELAANDVQGLNLF